MGTTADKLTYLNTTKGKIKDSINNLGGSIDSNTTFRDYATQLDSIYTRLPKVNGTGSEISLSPTLKGRLSSVINGDTQQDSYSGTQLFNAGAISNTNIIVSDDGKTITMPIISSGNGIISTETLLKILCPTLEVGDVVYLKATTTSQQNIYIYLSASDYLWYFNTSRTITQRDLDSSVNLYGNRYSVGETNQVIISNFRIVKNSTDTWEKFVGGTASPNPDYPQDIQSVEGIQNVVVNGKNLFNPENNVWGKYNVWQNNAGNFTNAFTNTFNVKGGEVCSISFKNNSGTLRPSYQFIDDENNYLSGNYWSASVSERKYQNISIPPNATKVIICQLDGKQEDDIQIQFEYNSTSTTYQPYQSQTYEVNLGTIKLYNGDYITGIPDNWSIKHVMGEVVLDGTQTIAITNWRASETSVGWVYAYNVFNNAYVPASNVGNIISNKLIASKFDDLFQKNKDNGIAVYTNTDYSVAVRTSDTTLTTASLINNYLSNNPIKIVYELATPTTETITDEYLISQLNALYNAKSCNGQTNISVDGQLPMILDVSALKDEI